MRSATVTSVLFLAATLCIGACAAPTEGDDVEEQTGNVTGGSSTIEPPVAFLFASASATSPTCVGAMLGDNVAVTAKSCAKTGMILGRASDKEGRGARATVTRVHVPAEPDAEIAVVELDKPLEGTRALLTHMPLRGGYTVNAWSATDGKGFFSPDKNDASSVGASIVEESATQGVLTPNKGAEICDGDMGAPVCATNATQIAGFRLRGTCGLAGIVVGRAEAAKTTATADPNAPATTPSEASACSGGAWKVASLGRYATFLKRVAPQAFEPLRIDKPVLRNFPYIPEGLWGWESAGSVTACKIESKTIAPVKPGDASEKLTAKVSFDGMQKRSAPWGRFGIAKKNDPKDVRWLPAGAVGQKAGAAFELSFEGVVSAAEAGDYIVSFRTSANGGESWTVCDVDGIASSSPKGLPLEVTTTPGQPSDPSSPQTPPSGGTTPQDAPPGTDYSDPPAPSADPTEGDGYDPSAEEDPTEGSVVPGTKKKKAAEGGGCSAATGSPASSGLPALGVLLGLSAMMRRRRR